MKVMKRRRALLDLCAITVVAVVSVHCGGSKEKDEEITDEENVQLVFENFQPTILKITSAGLAAKGTASQGANIPEIQRDGDVAGTLVLGGTVASSTGQNEQLSLWVELNDYSDTGVVTYQTDNTSNATKLGFSLTVNNTPPDNEMFGDIDGTLSVGGEVEGTGVFDLHIVSDLEDDDAAPDLICTRVTGTVTAGTSQSVDFVVPLDLSHLDAAQQEKCRALQ